VPLSGFIPQIEAAATARLGVPVRVGSLRLVLLPLPHLTLRAISIDDARGRVGVVKVWPALAHLLADVKVVREIRFEDVAGDAELIGRLARVRQAGGPVRVRVRRVVLERVELRTAVATLRDLRMVAELHEAGAVREVQVEAGRALRIVARPAEPGRWALDISARQWTIPSGPPVQFDRLQATAVLSGQGIETRDLSARLYGGRLDGALAVTWSPAWYVRGNLRVEAVRLQPLATLVAGHGGLSGKLSGKPSFNMRARRAAELLASLRLDADFVIEEGALQKVDLVAVARNPLASPPQQGETRFDELSGHLEIDPEGYHFSRLRVASGVLLATGEVSVARDRQLSGRVDAELRGTASLVTVPLVVSGSVGDPSFAPTKTALAGAIAGSVLLPGIGTAIGLKASQLTDRLFNRRRGESGDAAAPPKPAGSD
jgi:hypothetical protein